MKTSKSLLKRIFSMTFLVLLMVSMQNCVVDVPAEDPDPPNFSFRIVGDGFDHAFTQDTNFNNITLMLRMGVNYQFTFYGNDEGGMHFMNWVAVHTGSMTVDPNLHGEWNFNDSGGAADLDWFGSQSDPVSGSIIGGTFTTQGDVTSNGTFGFSVGDYGGESGRSNRVNVHLPVFFGAHNTRIRED